jgi:hypothetical protein
MSEFTDALSDALKLEDNEEIRSVIRRAINKIGSTTPSLRAPSTRLPLEIWDCVIKMMLSDTDLALKPRRAGLKLLVNLSLVNSQLHQFVIASYLNRFSTRREKAKWLKHFADALLFRLNLEPDRRSLIPFFGSYIKHIDLSKDFSQINLLLSFIGETAESLDLRSLKSFGNPCKTLVTRRLM